MRLLDDLARRVPPRGTELLSLRERIALLRETLPRRDAQIERLARRPVSSLGPTDLTIPELRRMWNAIATSAFVSEADASALALFFSAAEVQRWTPLSVVVREGQWLPRCYLVVEGTIEAVAGSLPRRFVPGEIFGERALLDDRPWSALHRTVGPATALRLDRLRYDERVAGVPAAEALATLLRRHGCDGEIAARGGG
jgi:CRP-like cAMP-binding protein